MYNVQMYICILTNALLCHCDSSRLLCHSTPCFVLMLLLKRVGCSNLNHRQRNMYTKINRLSHTCTLNVFSILLRTRCTSFGYIRIARMIVHSVVENIKPICRRSLGHWRGKAVHCCPVDSYAPTPD